ncbi:hypothetical protein E2C01_066651 [Portunus trituberculatus]|uniref:Uncharacterized protein n=1 Tax=Portunus trituberculatus TaxID=210409 RepID=A0A5B7HUE4_PORTR|nr:hypothetical protein [Portunus trituberculatus]
MPLGSIALFSSPGPMMNVTAVMEGKVLLPCDVATSIEGDLPIMMMFYRNESGTPIYT